jgi:hypothetical protein
MVTVDGRKHESRALGDKLLREVAVPGKSEKNARTLSRLAEVPMVQATDHRLGVNETRIG